jgi:hypothetical protein
MNERPGQDFTLSRRERAGERGFDNTITLKGVCSSKIYVVPAKVEQVVKTFTNRPPPLYPLPPGGEVLTKLSAKTDINYSKEISTLGFENPSYSCDSRYTNTLLAATAASPAAVANCAK